jgi:RNA polymerase sigma factor (sigma-70 family)
MENYGQKTDEELARWLQTNDSDQQAWSEVFRRVNGLIHSIIGKRFGGYPVEEREDVSQEVWIQLQPAILRFRGENPVGQKCTLRWYLTRVVQTVCYNIRRKRELAEKRQRDIENRLSERTEGYQMPFDATSDERDEAFMSLWKRLSTADQQILYLRYIKELPYKEIAEQFRITEANARKKVERALKQMRKIRESSRTSARR